MANRLRHVRLGWIALVAIVGVVSSSENAAAGTMAAECGSDQRCCVSRPMSACCTPSAPSQVETSVDSADPEIVDRAPNHTASLSPNVHPCECRASDPAAPASEPERRCPERRQGGDQSLDCKDRHAPTERPTPLTTSLVTPGSSPPRTPLYLRTSRLLF